MISANMSAQLKRQYLSLKSMVWMSQRKLSSRQIPDRADHHDIVIAGGGMVGSAAAIALSKLGSMKNKSIILLEAAMDKQIKISSEYSNRVSALAPSSVKLLAELGTWDEICSHGRVGEVHSMHVWDGCSQAGIIFNQEDTGDPESPLNYIVENDITLSALNNALKKCDNVKVLYNTKVDIYKIPSATKKDAVPDENVVIELSDGKLIETPLLVGADGFRSLVRKSISSPYVSWDYHQMGLVATLDVENNMESNHIAYQRFLPSGPIALLPLSKDKSSLVWTLSTEETKSMIELHEEEFLKVINDALHGNNHHLNLVNSITGNLKSILDKVVNKCDNLKRPPIINGVQNRAAFPLGFGHSARYIGTRTMLIGDAAHRVHPLAGQGANLGFGDIRSMSRMLDDCLREGGKIGQHSFLCQYETDRQRHNLPTMIGIDMLQKLYCTDMAPVVLARSLGLMTTHAINPIKKMIMSHAS